ncbi:MAG: 4-alpha-glucanotransferase, partial [Hyphomicrobiales bacterium]|nr:4-alpha-glucanotransferase [Hyphomicrobiales bacterium]
LFRAFCNDAGPRRAAFEAFRARMGEHFARHATFDALWEHFTDSGLRFESWRDWPTSFHDPENVEVSRFAAEHGERVLFYEYLQFLADEQLGRAQARARAAGMRLGLYLDIAVGVAGQGADMWADRAAFGQDVALGAPPDAFDPNGQNWALAPFNPLMLKARGYNPFADVLKAAMRHAGVVRIDHVLGFARTFWIPDGGLPGTYVRFRLDDLLAVTAAESRKAGAVVIGEDLGNVPEGLRDKLAERGLLSYRVAWFEREQDGTFRHPETYPDNTIATLTTHDLPTLGGFMAGRDIDWRETLGRQSADAIAAERDARERDRWALFRLVDFGGHPEKLEHLSLAVHRLLAASPAALVAASIEDALGLAEQPNMPGTVAEHPNWCRRLPIGVEELADDP